MSDPESPAGTPDTADALPDPSATAPAAEPELPGPPAPVPHAGSRYALLRLLALVAVGGFLYLVGMRGWLLAFSAVLISGIISLFLFMKQRNDAALNLERSVADWRHRHEGEPEDSGLPEE
jgi:hypothetical protein